MDTSLWIAAWVMAFGAMVAGLNKALVPRAKLAQHDAAAWTRSHSTAFVKSLGVLELLAAIGFVVPALVDVAPEMVPVTAVCWMALMIGAIVTHGRLGQWQLAMVCVVYFAIALFIAVGRFGAYSF